MTEEKFRAEHDDEAHHAWVVQMSEPGLPPASPTFVIDLGVAGCRGTCRVCVVTVELVSGE